MPADPALADRLREATGPSRELDAELALTFMAWPDWFFDPRGGRKAEATSPPGLIQTKSRWGLGPSWEAPAYTASLDAAIALVRATEPLLGLEIYTGPDGSRVRLVSAERTGEWVARATPALALCLALVEWRAKHGGA